MTYGHGTIIHGTRGLRYDTFLSRPMTSRIRLVGLSTATAKQQHRTRSTKLGAPSLWEVSISTPWTHPRAGRPSGAASGVRVTKNVNIAIVGGKTSTS